MITKSELTKNRIMAVVLGASWCITFLALVYIKVANDRNLGERAELQKVETEAKRCQEHTEVLSKQLGDQENQLRGLNEKLERALVEARVAEKLALEQARKSAKLN